MKKILIIDDDTALIEGLQIILEDEGYSVVAVTDCQSMLDVVSVTSKQAPQLIMLDFRLPFKDGGEVAKDLKRDKQTKKIPIIMMSASHNTKMIAEEVGADDFLEKPFDMDDVLRCIARHVGSTS